MGVIFSGLGIGAVYALIALGMSSAYAITRVINLAQAGFVVLAALLAVSLHDQAHLPLWATVVVVVVLMTVALILVEALVIRPAARRAAPDRLLLVTVGMLQAAGGIALIGWGNIPYTLSPFTGKAPVHLAGASVSTQTFWVLGALLVSVAALYGLLYATPLGLTMRATAENPDAARLVGVNVDRMRLLAFAISGATAGLAGATVIPLTFIGFDTAIPFAVYGFIAAVLGGLGRASGAVAAGLLLGLLEAALGRVVSGTLAEVVAIGVLIAILLVRPAGLLGSAEVGR